MLEWCPEYLRDKFSYANHSVLTTFHLLRTKVHIYIYMTVAYADLTEHNLAELNKSKFGTT